MRSALFVFRRVVLCAGLALASASCLLAQTDIQVTGRLFGYYRMEASESPAAPTLSAVASFQQKPGAILLGMGDNFAPEFGAGIQGVFPELDALGKHAPCYLEPSATRDLTNRAPESLYKRGERLPRIAECDNVARFLMAKGYTAVVPGREDFVYSMVWLRRMALLMSGANGSLRVGGAAPFALVPLDLRVHESAGAVPWTSPAFASSNPLMLAANLRVTFALDGPVADKTPLSDQVSSKICPLLFAYDVLGSSTTCDDASKQTVEMDWLDRMVSSLDTSTQVAMSNESTKASEFRGRLIANQLKVAQIAVTSLTPQQKAGLDVLSNVKLYDKLDNNELDFKGVVISKDDAGALSVNQTNVPGAALNAITALGGSCPDPDSCTILQALQQLYIPGVGGGIRILPNTLLPGNARVAAVRLLQHQIFVEQQDIGFTAVNQPGGGPRLIIIGVAGKETMQEISPVNAEICTRRVLENQLVTTADLRPCDPAPEDAGDAASKGMQGYGRLKGTLAVSDPLSAAFAAAVAAWDRYRGAPMQIVVMAQMPRTEAEVLATKLRMKLEQYSQNMSIASGPRVDLVLSEAEKVRRTAREQIQFDPEGEIPVVTPHIGYVEQTGMLVDPLTTVSLHQAYVKHMPAYWPPRELVVERCESTGNACDRSPVSSATTVSELIKLIPPSPAGSVTLGTALDGTHCGALIGSMARRCQDQVVVQYLLEMAKKKSKADVVLAMRRDLFFGMIPPEYVTYSLCFTSSAHYAAVMAGVQLPSSGERYCMLRIALDRVLWKGDYVERVMVDGASLQAMFTTAQTKSDNEQLLSPSDTTQEWLLSFGIASQPSKRLIDRLMGLDRFQVGIDRSCNDPSATSGTVTYCINGAPIKADGAYWVATSDHLAQDSVVYGQLAKRSNPGDHDFDNGYYVTAALAETLTMPHARPKYTISTPPATAAGILSLVQQQESRRNAWQVDAAKLIAGYDLQLPSVSDVDLQQFAGVEESGAQQPKSAEVDLEGMLRIAYNFWHGRLATGVQADAEYDRKDVGKIGQLPLNTTFSSNDLTTGAFVQMLIRSWHSDVSMRTVPRLLAVVAPFTLDKQLHASDISDLVNSDSDPLAVIRGSKTYRFLYRAGARYEFGGGKKWWQMDNTSYAEWGIERANQHNILQSLTYQGSAVCPVSAAQSLEDCVKGMTTTDGGGTMTPFFPAGAQLGVATTDLHAWGHYWTAHLSKAFANNAITPTLDTTGDVFLFPGKNTLPTQTRHAVTLSEGVGIAAFGNFKLTPTFTTFFYSNQVDPTSPQTGNQGLKVQSFKITLSWYFARDARVPFWRQLLYVGPASQSQTSSAKLK